MKLTDTPHTSNRVGLHPDNGTWAEYLENHCDIRGQHNGYTWHGATNCNYIVHPDGHIDIYYGFWGRSNFHRLAYGVFSYHLDGHIDRQGA